MGRGYIGFARVPDPDAVAAKKRAATALADVAATCVGPIMRAKAGRIRESWAPRLKSPDPLPNDANYFDGGPPSILLFWAEPEELTPGAALRLNWEVAGAERIEIVVVAGNSELPVIDQKFPGNSAGWTVPSVPASRAWEGEYELRAYNRCVAARDPITARARVRMRRDVAFVLSGGGARGSFQVGAVRFLHDHGIAPGLICGTSVGSINAIKLAEGSDPTGASAIEKLEAIWRDKIRKNSDMFLEEPTWQEVKDIPNLKTAQFFGDVSGDFLGAVFGRLPQFFALLPISLWDIFVGAAFEYARVLDALNRLLTKERSLYNLKPIRDKLYDPQFLDLAKVQRSGIRLRFISVSLQSGLVKAVDETGKWTPSEPAVDLREAVMASASIPVVFPPVSLSGELCVDGGVREITPILSAINAGATTIYAVLASAPIEAIPADDVPKRLKAVLEILGRSVGDVMIDEISLNDYERLPWPARDNTTLIRPRFNVHDSMEIDPGLIAISQGYGYMCAADQITTEPVDRMQAFQLADAITTLRRVNHFAEIQLELSDPEGLIPIRERKRRIADLVSQRKAIAAQVPAASAGWWQQWEPKREGFENSTLSPWHEYYQRGYPIVPAAVAPPP